MSISNNISAIHFRKNIQPIQNNEKPSVSRFSNTPQNDTFTKSTKQQTNESNIAKGLAVAAGLAVLGGLTYKAIKTKSVKPISEPIQQPKIINKYRHSLAQGVSEVLGHEVKEDALSSVLSKEEFLNVLPTLKKENYVASADNIKNGIFRADLHSHTQVSDGKISVKKLLDEVSAYSEQVYNKTKKDVIFSITDHDSMEGNKEALCIIAQSPEKFKHAKFVTGSEISFMHKATDPRSNPVETSEVLVYGFNPFSKKVSNFFEGITSKRNSMMTGFISEVSSLYPEVKFSEQEFLQHYPKSNRMANSHWALNHYGQTKYTLSLTAKSKNLNPEEYYHEMMSKAGKKNSLGAMKEQGLIENWINENPEISNIRKQYDPIVENDNFYAQGENTFEEIVSAFEDTDSVIGFAHPYYLSERINISKIPTMIDNMIKKSKGMFKLTESHHQAYKNDKGTTLPENINKVNKIMEDFGLIPLGGRDNHDPRWLS